MREPTFFSWLGVAMYLEGVAVDATLRAIAAFPPGSEVVLTFLQPRAPATGSDAGAASRLAARVASVGEPFVSTLEPEELEVQLRGLGFSDVTFLAAREARARYFSGRPPDLPPPRRTSIAAAVR